VSAARPSFLKAMIENESEDLKENKRESAQGKELKGQPLTVWGGKANRASLLGGENLKGNAGRQQPGLENRMQQGTAREKQPEKGKNETQRGRGRSLVWGKKGEQKTYDGMNGADASQKRANEKKIPMRLSFPGKSEIERVTRPVE